MTFMERQEESSDGATPVAADTAHAVTAGQIGAWSVVITEPPRFADPAAPEPAHPIDLLTLTLAAVGGALVVFIALSVWA